MLLHSCGICELVMIIKITSNIVILWRPSPGNWPLCQGQAAGPVSTDRYLPWVLFAVSHVWVIWCLNLFISVTDFKLKPNNKNLWETWGIHKDAQLIILGQYSAPARF